MDIPDLRTSTVLQSTDAGNLPSKPELASPVESWSSGCIAHIGRLNHEEASTETLRDEAKR